MRSSPTPLLILSTLFLLVPSSAASQAYENTAITRSYDLGGSTTFVSTSYNIKALVDNPGPYELALAGESEEEPAWWDVLIGGKSIPELIVEGGDGKSAPTVSIPTSLQTSSQSLTFTLSHLLTHPSKPLPTSIAQDDDQNMVFSSNSTWIDSYYFTKKETLKIRAPGKIISYSPVSDRYIKDSSATLKASLLTLGPYFSVPSTLSSQTQEVRFQQEPFTVHYPTTEPVLTIKKLVRLAEVSQWGGNLNVEDHVALFNDGPTLKGQFSRITHMQARFRPNYPAQVLRSLTLSLPPSARDPYYYDIIGNISTSHFRPSRDGKLVPASLELQMRYPMMGGWNNTFIYGWDMDLGAVLKEEAGKGGERKVLGVPFLTGLKDVVVDEAEVVITLPEGAKDVEVHAPFKIDSITHSVHKTYLDSTGRPRITLRKFRCTERHDQTIYVTYTYPFYAIFQKPLTVATAGLLLFLIAGVGRRINMNLNGGKKL